MGSAGIRLICSPSLSPPSESLSLALCPSVYRSIGPWIYLSLYLSIYPSISLLIPISVFIYMHTNMYIYNIHIHLFMCTHICLYTRYNVSTQETKAAKEAVRRFAEGTWALLGRPCAHVRPRCFGHSKSSTRKKTYTQVSNRYCCSSYCYYSYYCYCHDYHCGHCYHLKHQSYFPKTATGSLMCGQAASWIFHLGICKSTVHASPSSNKIEKRAWYPKVGGSKPIIPLTAKLPTPSHPQKSWFHAGSRADRDTSMREQPPQGSEQGSWSQKLSPLQRGGSGFRTGSLQPERTPGEQQQPRSWMVSERGRSNASEDVLLPGHHHEQFSGSMYKQSRERLRFFKLCCWLQVQACPGSPTGRSSSAVT